MKKSYVYKITCKITGEFYFGSSFNAKSDRYWGGGKRIRERISLYGKENFVKEIIGEFDDRVEAHKVENEYIKQFRNDDKCLNKRLDYRFRCFDEESRAKMSTLHRGEKNPMYGKNFSKEHREKLSAALCGKHLSDGTRAKMSTAKHGENHPMYGKHLSEEHRAKLSAAQLGKHLSEETRAKIGAAHRGKHLRKNPITGKREWCD